MLLKTVEFNSNSPAFTDNQEMNNFFLIATENRINDIIRYRGYIYLNQICEMLTVEWNPDDENPCIRFNADIFKFIELEVFYNSDTTTTVYIHRYE